MHGEEGVHARLYVLLEIEKHGRALPRLSGWGSLLKRRRRVLYSQTRNRREPRPHIPRPGLHIIMRELRPRNWRGLIGCTQSTCSLRWRGLRPSRMKIVYLNNKRARQTKEKTET